MYNSKVKEIAYTIKKRGLSIEGALASLMTGRLAHQFNRKEKFVRKDLQIQFQSIGGRS
ncbi:hypothetical protein [Bacillus toyonensis]|jgi:hypothetical protein|uniref:hypothetical protein n=1 Tax=Bacillus toyonensis TaxID=155322 RepID=UPI0015968881|nr:hypothetical protein [Bacillus toyonensis]